jgi:hypothetical protein
METASQQRVCVGKQASAESGRFTFNFAHTAKLAGNPPTVDGRGDDVSTDPSAVHRYRGGYHPLATGDGQRP